MEPVTIDTILDFFEESIANKLPISPSTFVDAAAKLAVLVGEENEKLFKLQQQVAQSRVAHMNNGESVSKAKVLVEATDEYREFQIQKSKIEQIFEFIRIAKLRARLTDEEYKAH